MERTSQKPALIRGLNNEIKDTLMLADNASDAFDESTHTSNAS